MAKVSITALQCDIVDCSYNVLDINYVPGMLLSIFLTHSYLV